MYSCLLFLFDGRLGSRIGYAAVVVRRSSSSATETKQGALLAASTVRWLAAVHCWVGQNRPRISLTPRLLNCQDLFWRGCSAGINGEEFRVPSMDVQAACVAFWMAAAGSSRRHPNQRPTAHQKARSTSIHQQTPSPTEAPMALGFSRYVRPRGGCVGMHCLLLLVGYRAFRMDRRTWTQATNPKSHTPGFEPSNSRQPPPIASIQSDDQQQHPRDLPSVAAAAAAAIAAAAAATSEHQAASSQLSLPR